MAHQPGRGLTFHDHQLGWMMLDCDPGPGCGWLLVPGEHAGWVRHRPAADDDLRRLAKMLFARYRMMKGA